MSLINELLDIREEHGSLTAELVLDAARADDHPLHDRFEWDDSIAGEKYRLEQARQMLRVVKLPPVEGRDYSLRAFVAVKGEDTNRAEYVPTEEAMLDDFTRKIVLRDMNREWLTFKRRYEHMREFADLLVGAAAEVAS